MSISGATFFDTDTPVSVLTTQPLGKPLDYKVPDGGCHLGAFVEVPLGSRKVIGVVWGPGQGDYDRSKLRYIARVLDAAPMRDELRDFISRASDYTLTPLPAMLRLTTRAPGLTDPPSMQKIYRRGYRKPARETKARLQVMDVLDEYGDLGFTLKELSELAGVTPSVVKGLVQQGAIFEEEMPRDAPYPRLDPGRSGANLNEGQKAAASYLRNRASTERFGATLLRGVTGSGKTEVYLEAVAETLQRGRQALVLLPEIALTVEFLARVEARFGARPAEWHSGITMTERRRLWKMVG
ncbi:MAG: DEAD/DEAH box helicase, partial [Pseudomonadota bacterium]